MKGVVQSFIGTSAALMVFFWTQWLRRLWELLKAMEKLLKSKPHPGGTTPGKASVVHVMAQHAHLLPHVTAVAGLATAGIVVVWILKVGLKAIITAGL